MLRRYSTKRNTAPLGAQKYGAPQQKRVVLHQKFFLRCIAHVRRIEALCTAIGAGKCASISLFLRGLRKDSKAGFACLGQLMNM